MKPAFAAYCLAALVTFAMEHAAAQLYQGPDTGAVARGAIVNTENFSKAGVLSFGGPLFREPRNKLRREVEIEQPDGPALGTAAATVFTVDAGAGAPVGGPPPILLQSFDGMRDPGNYIPPDPYVAAGPNHTIAVDNGRFRIVDKSGVTLKTIDADSWFQAALPTAAAFDPKVRYDHFDNRWIMVWLDQSDTQRRSYFLVAVSDDADPIGTWYTWAIPGGVNGSTPANNWADYQGVGYDREAVYVTSNNWEFSGGYNYSKIRILPKSDLYAGTAGPLRWIDFWGVRNAAGGNAFTIRPVIMFGDPGETYFVSVPGAGNSVTLFRLTNPLTDPVLTAQAIGVGSWNAAPAADQLGGSKIPIESGSSSLTNEPVYQDGSIWLTHSIASGPLRKYSAVRYLRINTASNTAVEDGALGKDGYWYFYPAIAVDKDGNIAMTYSRSGESEYIGACMSWRLAADEPSVLRRSVLLQPGSDNYVKDFSSGRNRWGDYMGIAIDPATRDNFWMYTQYTGGSNTWAAWYSNVRLVPYPEQHVTVDVRAHDFGPIEVGTPADTLAVRIYNVGQTSLRVQSVTLAGTSFRMVPPPALPRDLGLYDSLVVRVTFAPDAHGSVTDSLLVTTTDPSAPISSVRLLGKGIQIGRAEPGKLYASSSSSRTLYGLSVTDGASTIGPTNAPAFQALAIHPLTHELLGSASGTDGTTFYRVSAPHGDALPFRETPLGNLRGFVYLTPDTILAVGFTPGLPTGRVYKIGPGASDTILVGSTSNVLFSGVAISPTTGTVWTSVTPPLVGRDRIYRLDVTTGLPSLVGNTGFSQGTPSLACDPLGTLYGLTSTGSLISIDTTTGSGTLLLAPGITGLNAIATRPDSLVTSTGDDREVIPGEFALHQNYPNPFNPTTEIRYQVPWVSTVKLAVYDLLGREVAVLVDERREAGSYQARFDASALSSGVYLYRLESRGWTATRRMILIK